MAFFKQIGNAMSDLVRMATGSSSPYKVEEVSLNSFSRCTILGTQECVSLLKDGNVFTAILKHPPKSSKVFSLFRLASENEATTLFSNISFKLTPLLDQKMFATQDGIQRFCDTLRQHPTWSSAHIAAHFGLTESFRNMAVKQLLDSLDDTDQTSPIQLAVEGEHLETIQELLISGAKLTLADHEGNNVFHYAAKTKDPTIIQYLASKDPSAINQLNMFGEGPLHIACLHDQPANVEQLLRWGAQPQLTMSFRFPIHCAMKVGSVGCVEVLCRWSKEQMHVADSKYGGTPLHWAKNRQCIYSLADLGCNLEAPNTDGETALHIMVKRNRLECVMGLLSRGADASAKGCHSNTTLHMAIEVDNADLVQALIVFGADVNAVNKFKVSPRHMVTCNSGKNKDLILHYLHGVGALRCPPTMASCLPGCSGNASFNGSPMKPHPADTPEDEKVFNSMMTEVAMTAALTRSASATGSSIMVGETCDSSLKSMEASGSPGDRVLCLDGGGIRGLVLIQILLAIEKVVGQPIRNCFDWVGGTSTGGILALAIVHGKTMHYAQGLYFRLKDEVFQGKRPYNSEPLEKFMKREFGQNTRMTEVEYPKVIVTGVLGDRSPAELHLFRNYEPPGTDYTRPLGPFEAVPRPNEQYVWRAARCSGAAPTYFRAFGPFLDGGLIANNPTLDVMTEIHEHNMALKAVGQGHLERPMHVVVSLGTGRVPPRAVNVCDVYRPEGLLDIAKVASGAKNLTQLLIDQVTMAEGRPVDRARAWCSMIGVPYVRISPLLSEDIPLDCSDDRSLINMLWETQCYLHKHEEKLAKLATLLWP